jgi:heme A synthase
VKRLPAWMLGILALLTALLMWVGIDERHEIGPVPIILAVLWIVFILASAPKIFGRDDH